MDNIEAIRPKTLFMTTGIGRHREKLASFELALRNASIEKFNLVNVSSIYPPDATIIDREQGLERLMPGQIVFCVMAKAQSNEPGRRLAASIGVATPQVSSMYGYLSEHHSYGQQAKDAGDYAEDLAAEMLASTLGIPFDIDSDYDEKRDIFRMDGRIVNTRNVTSFTQVDDKGRWTTCVAAAVFVP